MIPRDEDSWLRRALPNRPGEYHWRSGGSLSWVIVQGRNRFPVVSGTGYGRAFGLKLFKALTAQAAKRKLAPKKGPRRRTMC
jgi:hypothetical protein